MKKPLAQYISDNKFRLINIKALSDEYCEEYNQRKELLANQVRFERIMKDINELVEEIKAYRHFEREVIEERMLKPLAEKCREVDK